MVRENRYSIALLFCLFFSLVPSLSSWSIKAFRRIAGNSIIAIGLTVVPLSSHALEQQYKLPPIDFKDKNRCQFISSNMGQANAARDKLNDLRQCDMRSQSAEGKDLSGIIAADADFSGVNFKETQISK